VPNTYTEHTANKSQDILNTIGDSMQDKLKGNWDNVARQQVERDLGVYIAMVDDMHVFAGLTWTWASTRGTRVFLSCLETVKNEEVPLRAQKIKVILTGKLANEGVDRPALASGVAWKVCPPATLEILKQRFEESVGHTSTISTVMGHDSAQWTDIIKEVNASTTMAPQKFYPSRRAKNDDDTYDEYVAILEDYYSENEKTPGPTVWFKHYPIGAWVHKQCMSETVNRLPWNRKKQLEKIDKFKWHTPWEYKFDLLKKFYIANNKLPEDSERIEGMNLLQWIDRQTPRLTDGRVHSHEGVEAGMRYRERYREIPDLPQFNFKKRKNMCYRCRKVLGHIAKDCTETI